MERVTLIKGRVKQIKTVGLSLKKGVNSVVPGADVTSDLLTFLELMEHGDQGWAIAVFVFMFVPFLFKLSEFVVEEK